MSRRPFVALALAQIFSLSGTRLSMIAIPWLVLDLTNDAFLTGVTAFAELLPYVLAKALGGPWIDRLGARRIAVLGDIGSVLAVGAVPLFAVFGLLGFHSLLPLVFAMGLLRGPADAAKQALIPQVAAAGSLPLERVTGTLGTIDRLATTLGAGVAGGLVALIGAAPALAVNALAFALSALAVAIGVARSPRAGASAGYRRDLAEGWGFLRHDAVLMGIVVMVALTNFFDQAFAAVMLPVWAKEVGGGPGAFGGLIAVLSAFAVAGAMLATMTAERLPRLRVYVIGFLIAGAPRFLVFLPGVPLPVLIGVLALAGFGSGFLNPIISAVMFERIPQHLTGRVSALITALAWVLMPFGGLAGGWAISAFGLPATLWVTAAAYFAATMLPLLLPGFRAFAERPGRGAAA